MLLLRVAVFLLAALTFSTARAETAKIALIITNKDYPPSVGRLENTHRDGELIGAALTELGFKVVHKRDLSKELMVAEVAAYVGRLSAAGDDSVGFFYYSGHGAANSKYGENYLIPVAAPVTADTQLPLLAVKLGDVVDAIGATPSKANFVVFDACRNVPNMTVAVKSATKGLARVENRRGMLVAFATEPGNVASDEGAYAVALAEIIKKPGMEAVQVFREVRRQVLTATERRQFPWTAEALEEDFYFQAGVPLKPSKPEPPPPPLENAEALYQRAIDYATGRRGAKNEETAVYYYRLAAKEGHLPAMHNLAARLYLGQGVKQNGQEALLWYRRAANGGYALSMYVLAVRYVKGIDVSPSTLEAANWMMQALENGSEEALKEMTSKASSWDLDFIREMQRRLHDRGLYRGAINGVISSNYIQAINNVFHIAR